MDKVWGMRTSIGQAQQMLYLYTEQIQIQMGMQIQVQTTIYKYKYIIQALCHIHIWFCFEAWIAYIYVHSWWARLRTKHLFPQ